jgi:hypothetical protein
VAWARRATTTRTSKSRALAEGYRSGLEEKVAAQLAALEVPATYEAYTLRYERPAKVARYTPDFVLPNGVIIETKGRFVTADRQKHLHVKLAHPDLDVRFVFSNPNSKIGKKSETTYAMWCNKHGFQYAAKLIPPVWVEEPAVKVRLEANAKAFAK